MCIRGNPEQLIERWLAGAMVADRQLTHPYDQIDEDDVAANTPCHRYRRHVVPAGIAVGAETLGNESSRDRDQLGR
jgi:hypothetical protein